jgi:Domain of unknown function (DUF4288)
MAWYAAHVVMYVQFKDAPQDQYPVWENIFLVEGDTEEAARSRAEALGRQGEGDSDGSFRWEQRPAAWVFGGIRKLIQCDSGDDQPSDGTEITYSEMMFPTKQAVLNFVRGTPTDIKAYD